MNQYQGTWIPPYYPCPIPQSQMPAENPARIKTPIQALDTSSLLPITDMELANLNPPVLELVPEAKFLVMRSYCEDDIHKSVKYGIWTSEANQKVDRLLAQGGPLYLFFSVYGSSLFVGCAEVSSAVNFKAKFLGWYPDFSAMGCFSVRWIFVRDLSYEIVERVQTVRGVPVTEAEDAEELDFKNGKKMVRRFMDERTAKSMIEDFTYYNQKEEFIRGLQISS